MTPLTINRCGVDILEAVALAVAVHEVVVLVAVVHEVVVLSRSVVVLLLEAAIVLAVVTKFR